MALFFTMTIILYQPQIPQNTGNIVRTCSVTGRRLILVEPLGFSTGDRWLKRAGLDYWDAVSVEKIDNLEHFLENFPYPFYFLSSKASKCYADVSFTPHDALIFGSETEGLPERFRERWPERFITVPMVKGARCLNLATTVGIVTYEAWRQNGFMLLDVVF